MPENKKEENTENGTVDLSSLSNMQFATAWTEASTSKFDADKSAKRTPRFGKKPSSDFRKPFNKERGERQRGFDKRRGGKPAPEGADAKRDGAKFGHKHGKGAKPAPFKPSMEILFYPDDAPFEKLAEMMKLSKRTYQLFDIAQLVLEKPERFIVLAKNLPEADGTVKPLFCAQPLNLPFEDEQRAKSAAVEYYMGELFEKESVDAEPPKGNFQVVNRCSLNGELLGAPNWHRYGEFLREYHAEKFPHMRFEKFLASIETVREPEAINSWLESMKKRDVYKLKTPEADGTQKTFDTRDEAERYILETKADELVKTYEQARMKGANIKLLPFGRIRKNIEETVRLQRRFPIVTANNLRGRLRRAGFAVYKRGSKGFAYVSAIKRKFLFEGEKLSEAPQKIFDFVTANQLVKASALPYMMMGLEVPKAEEQKTENPEVCENATQETSETPANAPETSSPALDAAQTAEINAIMKELSWLISEGYIVEYVDSTLQANAYMPRPKADNTDAAQPAEEATENAAENSAEKTSGTEAVPEAATNPAPEAEQKAEDVQ